MSILRFYCHFIVIFLSLFTFTQQRPFQVGESSPGLIGDTYEALVINTNISLDEVIPNSYIVVYKDDASENAIEAHQQMISAEVEKRSLSKRVVNGRELSSKVHTISIQGWRGMCLDAEDSILMKIKNSPEVAFIEADTRFTTFEITSQDKAPLGLARLSHSSLDKGQKFKYFFDDTEGEVDVVAYVLDTGIRTTHKDFEGRAEMGANFVDEVDEDLNGHGTHVAGTIAGKHFGVAKNARLKGVKVLNKEGKGSNSLVIQGLKYVADDVKKNKLEGRAVVNVSIGGKRSEALNSAIESLSRDGVTVVVAAGNSNKDAENVSPASALAAITVGAIDASNDKLASFSNYGDVVDVFAPGVKVESVGIEDDSATKILSGTSMAAPHISGLALYLISTEPDLDHPEKVLLRILELAKSTDAEVENGKKGTTKLIAYNGSGR